MTNPSKGRILATRSVLLFKLDWDKLSNAKEKLTRGMYNSGGNLYKYIFLETVEAVNSNFKAPNLHAHSKSLQKIKK